MNTVKEVHKPLLQIASAFPQVAELIEAVDTFIANYEDDLAGRSRSFDNMVAVLTGVPNERERN